MSVLAVSYAALMIWAFRNALVNILADGIARGIERSRRP